MIKKRKTARQCKILIGDILIKQVQKLNSLGSMITADGKCDLEIRRRIGMAKGAFQKLGSYVFSILTYGSECRTMSQGMEKRIETVEMRFLR